MYFWLREINLWYRAKKEQQYQSIMHSEKVETVARDEDQDLEVKKVVVDNKTDVGFRFLT